MLYQRHRPQSLDEVVGNTTIVASLKKLVKEKSSNRPHAYLFHGPSGCGKTTLARILSKEFGCTGISLVELNGANLRGIDTAREIAETAQTAPLLSESKSYIIDESQQLMPAAQQALLKVIEDCPKHVYFFFCTTDLGKVIDTIKNRCAKYQVASLRPSEMRTLVTQVATKESIPNIDDAVQQALVQAAGGCPRQGLMLLEQIRDIPNPVAAIEHLATAEIGSKEAIELCREIISKRVDRTRGCIDLCTRVDADPESIRLSILGYLKKTLIGAKSIADAGRMAEMIAIFEKPTYSGGEATLIRMVFESTLVE